MPCAERAGQGRARGRGDGDAGGGMTLKQQRGQREGLLTRS